jgi:G:T-mismatch repair DNA endonuclease (very short patch repair protein)
LKGIGPKIRPSSNTSYWAPNIKGDKVRDAKNTADPQDASWQILVVWEYQITDEVLLKERIVSFSSTEIPEVPPEQAKRW